MDRYDARILSELQSDGRISWARLAEKISLSPSACQRRVEALIDRGIIDRLVLSTGSVSIGFARRLGAIDIAVDRQVVQVGTGSVGIARWLGRIVDTAGITRTVDGLGRGVDASGRAAGRYEPRTLQHNLLVVVLFMIAALAFFYWIAG